MYLRSIAIIIDKPPTIDVIKDDPKDNMILSCALSAKVDHVVSGDAHLKDLKIYQEIEMIAPSQFLQKLRDLNNLEDKV